MRTKGSCRFEPYFKVEVWDKALMCWKPIQKSHQSKEAAESSAPSGNFRILAITENGISPSELKTKI